MTDIWRKQFHSFEGPATDGFAIIPANSTVFAQPTRAIYVGSAGNLCVQMAASTNTVLTFVGIAAGTTIPIRVSIVFSNTTANSLVGLF